MDKTARIIIVTSLCTAGLMVVGHFCDVKAVKVLQCLEIDFKKR